MAGQMTEKSICSEPVFAAAREHSVCGFGPVGEGMAADLQRADAQPDITGSVLEQELASLHSRTGIEDMDMSVSCGLTLFRRSSAARALHDDRLRGACFPS